MNGSTFLEFFIFFGPSIFQTHSLSYFQLKLYVDRICIHGKCKDIKGKGNKCICEIGSHQSKMSIYGLGGCRYETVVEGMGWAYTGWSVCSDTINRGCPEAVSAVMTKSFNP